MRKHYIKIQKMFLFSNTFSFLTPFLNFLKNNINDINVKKKKTASESNCWVSQKPAIIYIKQQSTSTQVLTLYVKVPIHDFLGILDLFFFGNSYLCCIVKKFMQSTCLHLDLLLRSTSVSHHRNVINISNVILPAAYQLFI